MNITSPSFAQRRGIDLSHLDGPTLPLAKGPSTIHGRSGARGGGAAGAIGRVRGGVLPGLSYVTVSWVRRGL
jgi:hypothetical protein